MQLKANKCVRAPWSCRLDQDELWCARVRKALAAKSTQKSLLILSLLSVASALTNIFFAANYSFDKAAHLWKVNETMNQFSFDVIGNKRENPEDPNTERKEDGFPVQNVELLIGYWTCRGPLTEETYISIWAMRSLRTTLRTGARMNIT